MQENTRILAESAGAILRHEGHVGFQFSGGRDSTAALYLLRAFWPLMTVYHLDTGDQFPETRAVVDKVCADLDAAGVRFVRICTDVKAQREEFGYPSDIVPTDNTALGVKVSGLKVKLQDRYQCCAINLMMPMHQRAIDDGITLLIRGQRDDEYASQPLRSGDTSDGFEVLYPVQSWTAEDVMAYIEANGLPIAPFYSEGVRRAPECMGCTAWLDEGRSAYMRRHHPKEHGVFLERMAIIRGEIDRSMRWFDKETGG